MTDLIKGLDVSTIQGNIDWNSVAAAGYQFVICRCGVGNGGKDANFDKNIAGATAAGLKVAAYHFVYPLPPLASQPLRDPVKQARLHAGWAGSSGKVPVVCCDLEWPTPQDWAKWGCTATQIVQWTITYLEAYESATGIRPVIYTYPNFAQSIHLPDDFGQKYKLWIASYTNTPNVPKPWTEWVMWQDSGGTQKLPNGVPVDTDKAKDLSLWDVQDPVVVSPPPPPPPPPSEPDVPAPVPEPLPAPIMTVPAPKVTGFLAIWQFILSLFAKLFK